MSSQTVEKIFERGAQMLKPTRDKIKKEKVHLPPPHLDESDHEGEPKRWIGAERTDDAVAYFHAQNHSARDLISQAEKCTGIIVRGKYDTIFPNNIKQRYTQHIERQVRNILERTKLDDADRLYNELAKKLKKLRRWALEGHPTQSRKAYITRLQNWLKCLISNYRESTNELMQKFGTTLENAVSEMFTFVMFTLPQTYANSPYAK